MRERSSPLLLLTTLAAIEAVFANPIGGSGNGTKNKKLKQCLHPMVSSRIRLISSQNPEWELGGLAHLDRSKYPDFPELRLVDRDVSLADEVFPDECYEFKFGSGEKNFYYFIVMLNISIIVVATFWFWLRRDRPPVKARPLGIVLLTSLLILVEWIMVGITGIYGVRTPCRIVIIPSFLAGGPVAFLYIYRGLALLYRYRWSQAKLKARTRDWYYNHRWFLTWKGFVPLFLGHYALCSILLIVYLTGNPDKYGPGISFLEGSRCKWWDLNEEVVEAAAKLNPPVDLEGLAPYMPHFKTCNYCQLPLPWAAALCAFLLLHGACVVVVVFLLRKINDLYYLWRELMFCLVSCVIFLPMLSLLSLDTGDAFDVEPYGNILEISLGLFLIVPFFGTIIYPICLSYSKAFRMTGRKAPGSKLNNTSAAISNINRSHPSGQRSQNTKESLLSGKGQQQQQHTHPHDSHRESSGSNRPQRLVPGFSGTYSPPLLPAPLSPGHPNISISLGTARTRKMPAFRPTQEEKKKQLFVIATTGADGKVKHTLPPLSLTLLIEDPVGFELARQAAIESFDVESLEFYMTALDWKRRMQRGDVSQDDAWKELKEIFETFVDWESPLEINVSSKSRKDLEKIVTATKVALNGKELDALLSEIKTLLTTNLIPRFTHSRFSQLLLNSLVERGMVKTPEAAGIGQHNLQAVVTKDLSDPGHGQQPQAAPTVVAAAASAPPYHPPLTGPAAAYLALDASSQPPSSASPDAAAAATTLVIELPHQESSGEVQRTPQRLPPLLQRALAPQHGDAAAQRSSKGDSKESQDNVSLPGFVLADSTAEMG